MNINTHTQKEKYKFYFYILTNYKIILNKINHLFKYT